MDITKAAFRTHYSYFEFLTMSFGMNNAFALHTDLMICMFKPHLNWFMIVFFDDTLAPLLCDLQLYSKILCVGLD